MMKMERETMKDAMIFVVLFIAMFCVGFMLGVAYIEAH